MAKGIHSLRLGKLRCLLPQSSKEPLGLPELSMCLHYLLLHHLVVSVGFTISLTSRVLQQKVKTPSSEVHPLLAPRPTPSISLTFLIPDLSTPHEIKRLTTTSTPWLKRSRENIHPLLRRK
jgi:hypothetical protein